jgi:hypothetical protein
MERNVLKERLMNKDDKNRHFVLLTKIDWLIEWGLTPLSAVFQLYRGGLKDWKLAQINISQTDILYTIFGYFFY